MHNTKKVKHISIGDKVFAKVKGYPAWPARVEEELGKRFKVVFYGTGETGLVKSEDLFPYLEHKEQFTKSLKRKDYNEAIEEIEAAIREDGYDVRVKEEVRRSLKLAMPLAGNEKRHITSTVESENEDENKRGLKRKLSVDSTSGSETKKKSNPVKFLTENKKRSQTPVRSSEDEKNSEGKEKGNISKDSIHRSGKKMSVSAFKEECDADESVLASEVTEASKFKILTPQNLRDAILEVDKSLDDSDSSNELFSGGTETIAQNELLLARISADKFIGIKLNQNVPEEGFKKQSDWLRWRESDYKNALKTKENVENGTLRVEDAPELFELEPELTSSQLKDAIKDRIMERKRIKLKFLKIEANMVELDASIKTNLALDKANPKEALKNLDIMLELNVEKLMLKKHPHVMDMIKRLRRYIGNVKEWKLEGKQLEDFKKDAELIRNKADIVYNKFRELFNIPENKTFWEFFSEECENFKKLTKDMQENQVFVLCAEPGTKQAYLDGLDDQEETKLMSERNDKKFQDKENSSQVINSEETFPDVSTIKSDHTHSSPESHS